jgi:cytochrome b involved in lipid metabolism
LDGTTTIDVVDNPTELSNSKRKKYLAKKKRLQQKKLENKTILDEEIIEEKIQEDNIQIVVDEITHSVLEKNDNVL